jgi:hypothetical protein
VLSFQKQTQQPQLKPHTQTAARFEDIVAHVDRTSPSRGRIAARDSRLGGRRRASWAVGT